MPRRPGSYDGPQGARGGNARERDQLEATVRERNQGETGDGRVGGEGRLPAPAPPPPKQRCPPPFKASAVAGPTNGNASPGRGVRPLW